MGRNKKKSNNNVNVTKTSANTTAPAADASISTTNDNNTTNTTSSTSSNQPPTSSSSLIDALQNTNTDTENLKLRIKKAKQQLSKVVDILKMDNRSEWTESSMTDTNIIAGSCSSTTDDHNKIITEDEKLKNIKTTGKDAVKLENIKVIESSVSVVEQQQQQQQPKAKKRNRNKNINKTQTEELNNDNVNNESVEKSVNDQLLPIQKNQVDKIEQQNNETPPAPQKQPKRKNKKSKNMVTETVVVDDTSVLNSSVADETDDCLRKNNDDDTLAVVNLPSTLQQESTESKREDDDDKVIIDKNTIVKESTIVIQSKESVPIANDEKTQKIEGKTATKTAKDVVMALNEMDKVNDASCDMTNKTKKPNKKQKKQMEKEQTKQIIEEKISLTSCNKPEEQLTNQTETVSELNQNLPLSPLEISTGNPDIKSKNNIIMTNENEQKEIVEKIIFEKFNILSNKINPNSGVDPAIPPPSPSSTPKNHNNNNNSDATNQSLKTGQNTCNVKGSGKKHKGAKLTEKNIEQSTATAATITKDSNFTEETVELRETELSKPNEKIQMTDETIIVVKEPIDKHPPSGGQNNSNLNKIEPSEIKQQPIIEELVKKGEKFEENNLNKNPPSPAKKDKNKKKDVKKSLNDNKTSKEDQKTSKEEQKASDLKPIGQNENIDLSVDKQSTDKTTPKDTNNNNKEKSIEMPSSVLNENIPINPIDLIDRTSETTTATSNKTIVDSIIENVLQQIECTKLIDDESQINQVENIEQLKSPKSPIHDNNNALESSMESFVSIISSDDIIINEQLSLPVVELKDENKAQSSDTGHSIGDVKDDIILTEISCDDAEIFEIITQTSKTNHDIDKKKPPTKLTELITKNIPNSAVTSSKSTKNKSSKSPDPSHHTNKKLKNDNRSVVEPNKKSSNKEVICPPPQHQQHVNKSKQIKMKTNNDQSAINTDQPEISSSSLAAAAAAAVMTTSTDELLIIEKETIINTEEESNETQKIIDPTKQQLEQQQQSLLSTISKNAEGSDFVQSVKLTSSTEATTETKTTNQFETKSLVKQLQSPKLVKDLQNLQQSINEKTAALAATGTVAATEATTSINEDNEMKHHELPEKTAQQKLDSIQFSDIKLINNLEAKMTISNNATSTNNQLTKNKNDQLENVIASSSSAPPIPPTRPTRLSKKPQIPPKPEHLLKNLSKKITPLLMEQLNNYDNNNNDITTTNLKSSISSSNDDNNSKQSTSASSILVQSLLSSPPQPDDEFIKMPLHDVAAAEKVNVNDDDDIDEDDDDFEDVAEEYIEYKFTPRQMFMSTICHICKISLTSEQYTLHQCGQCKMIGYCSQEHCANDLMTHKPLCGIIQEIARKRGGHIYNNARILNNDDYRSLRVHTLSICENLLARPLQPFEREILLFPRLCIKTTCREWRQHLLVDCSACGQVSYCREHPEHLQMEIHETWCKSFALYQALVKEQIEKGRIEPELPTKIVQLNQYNILHKNFDSIFKDLYKNYSATIRDNCTWATLTQLATAPLTAFYGSQIARQVITERMVIHLIGAELQFEADTLDKWETFFLHLIPQLMELQIVFIGPELNVEHLPLEILSRIRMCRHCRQSCRCVKFDFQWGKLYHDYCKTSAFIKPDLICYFNPGLYRKTGYNGLDTWPETIKSSLNYDCPIIVTSYTEMEAPCDLQRIQQESIEDIKIIKLPHKNPFSAQRPERNFISDEIAPMIFKNYYYFIIK